MAEASEFMRASDSHGHNTRITTRFSTDVADHMYRLIGEDRGIEYRNVQDAIRDWSIDGAEAFEKRINDPELTRAVSAFSRAAKMERRLQQFQDERDLVTSTENVLRAEIAVDQEELQATLDSIKNARNREDFRRVCMMFNVYLTI